jgi:hypothetical protein
VTALTTRLKGIAHDIKPDIGAVVNTYQLKVSVARVDRCDAGSSHWEKHVPGGDTPGRQTLLGETSSWETHSPGRNMLLGDKRSPEIQAPGRESPRKLLSQEFEGF